MNKSKKLLLFLVGVIITLALVISLGTLINKESHAEVLENDVEVEPNTTLTYFLNVSYDGKDLSSVQSNATTVSEVNSGYLYVEDKLPEGLTFDGFVESQDGSIGAVKRGTEEACAGYVVDDTGDSVGWNTGNTEFTYHGLHYDAATRVVSFKTKNLKAGCELIVGIKTITPATVDDPLTTAVEKRRDFWNYGTIRENDLTDISNMVHVYMGDPNETLYTVKYEYTGTVPAGAPSVPADSTYAQNAPVNVASNPQVEGYTFSGWSTTDATVTNGVFTMPNRTVTLRGSFTKIPESQKHKVTYVINGTAPEGYEVPAEKTYYEGHTVEVDSLKPGDVVNGYRFLGWNTTDVTISEENDFAMPNSDVTLTGSFEQIVYNVEYRFYDTLLPANWESLIPPTETHAPGETVALAPFPEAPGYKFLGWYADENFEMPERDVVIYGEWMEYPGEFTLQIAKTITNPKQYYVSGDTVNFTITVTNPESFSLKEVIIKEHLDDVEYLEGTGYEIKSPHFVEIPTLAAGASVDINAKYEVGDNKFESFTNVAEVLGALSDNGYILKEGEYKAEVDFKKGQSTLQINKIDSNGNSLTGAEFTLSSKPAYPIYEAIKDEAESGSGYVAKYTGEHNDTLDNSGTKDIYYFTGKSNNLKDKWNVKFAGKCWEMIRTTDTGGVKLIYNGEWDETNKCNSNRNLHKGLISTEGTTAYLSGLSTSGLKYYGDSFTYDEDTGVFTLQNAFQSTWNNSTIPNLIGKFTCSSENTVTCNGTIYGISTDSYVATYTIGDTDYFQIGTSPFNANRYSPAMQGYMFNSVYFYNSGTPSSGSLYGMDVTYSNGTYTLINTRTSKTDSHRYSCANTSGSCSRVRYYYYSNNQYYVELSGGKKVEDVDYEMLLDENVNRYNSNIKTVIESWYAQNMISYSSYLEDVIYCGGRTANGFTTNGAIAQDTTNLYCTNVTDQFSVSNDKAKLAYPVGLATRSEKNLGNNLIFDKGNDFWLMTANGYSIVTADVSTSSNSDRVLDPNGVRPVISLKSGTTYTSGTGTMMDPYVIENVTPMEDQTGLSFNLVPGEYILRETKAPSGYQIDNIEYKVTVLEDGTVNIQGKTLTNDETDDTIYIVDMVNEEIDLLPNTGGRGIYIYIIGGIILVGLGILGYTFNKKGGKKK